MEDLGYLNSNYSACCQAQEECKKKGHTITERRGPWNCTTVVECAQGCWKYMIDSSD